MGEGYVRGCGQELELGVRCFRVSGFEVRVRKQGSGVKRLDKGAAWRARWARGWRDTTGLIRVRVRVRARVRLGLGFRGKDRLRARARARVRVRV